MTQFDSQVSHVSHNAILFSDYK